MRRYEIVNTLTIGYNHVHKKGLARKITIKGGLRNRLVFKTVSRVATVVVNDNKTPRPGRLVLAVCAARASALDKHEQRTRPLSPSK